MNKPKSIPTVDEYFDTRRSLKDGSYPVKIKVYNPTTQEKRFYNSGIRMSQTDYDLPMNSRRIDHQVKTQKVTLEAIKAKARDIIQGLTDFNFEAFEEAFLHHKQTKAIFVKDTFDERISQLLRNDRLGNADAYTNALNSLNRFVKATKRTPLERTRFTDINPDWLEAYERYMDKQEGKSVNTISIYLRCLKALFNDKIRKDELTSKEYPFSKHKYQIPATKKVNKALDPKLFTILLEAKPIAPHQIKARDFFVLSFLLCGINVKDLLQLRHKDYSGELITFIRAKTKGTTKGNQKPITIPVSDKAAEIIKRYSTKENNPDTYLFDIIKKTDSPQTLHNKTKAFTRLINQHIKVLCKEAGIEDNVSYQKARHSFATTAVRMGTPLHLVQLVLGHTEMKTTENYVHGFPEETFVNFAKSMENLILPEK